MSQGAPGSGATRPPASAPDRSESSTQEAAEQARQQGQEVAEEAREQGRDVATTARDEAQGLAETTREESRELVGTAREEAVGVAEEAATQARGVAEDAIEQLHDQARHQTRRAADSLHSAGEQLRALADGRPEEAGPMRDYARTAARQVDRVADRVDELGFDGIVDEAEGLARRRPGAFLLGALASGVLVGRIARNRRSGDGR